MKSDVFRDPQGLQNWRLLDERGQVAAVGAKGYKRLDAVLRAAERHATDCGRSPAGVALRAMVKAAQNAAAAPAKAAARAAPKGKAKATRAKPVAEPVAA